MIQIGTFRPLRELQGPEYYFIQFQSDIEAVRGYLPRSARRKHHNYYIARGDYDAGGNLCDWLEIWGVGGPGLDHECELLWVDHWHAQEVV